MFECEVSPEGRWRRMSKDVSSANFASRILVSFADGEVEEEKSRVEMA